jgi:hypothetical protein
MRRRSPDRAFLTRPAWTQANREYLLQLRSNVAEYAKRIEEALTALDKEEAESEAEE